MFASRCVINVALLAMVSSAKSNSTHLMNETSQVSTNSAPTFDWNQAQQGVIIGSYFYSYTAIQISTGFLADKFNVVRLGALSHLLATLVTFIIPFAARANYIPLVILRILLGFIHGPTFPCLYILFEKWFPPQEKAFAQAIMTVGTNVGVAFVMPITAWLCNNGFAGGWPSAFYCMGLANLVFTILYFTTITANPDKSPFVSEEEKKFISANVIKIPKRKVKVPWKSMFLSLPLWSVTIARGISSLGYHTVNSKIPLYLETILGYPLQGNGLINSAFYLAEALGQFISGPLSKFIATKGYLNLTVTRKLFESIALLGPALFLLSIPLLSGKAEIIVLGLILTMFTMGATSGGDIPIVPEMAPGVVGTVFGFANTISCASGFLAPMTIGYIIGDEIFSVSKWNTAFYFFGGLQVIGAVFFTLFATSKPQSWALVENTTKVKKCQPNNTLNVQTNSNDANNNQTGEAVEMGDKSVVGSNDNV
uniref:Major facilitator superfamily (MFS) profile domain-containing protein n=2 Tax=Tetranychus urticae TaxID=32264 RepID=T1JWQ3_TETUR